jgi:hypothetical protein
MSRDPRFIPEAGAVVAITSRAVHGRHRLRPDAAGNLYENPRRRPEIRAPEPGRNDCAS